MPFATQRAHAEPPPSPSVRPIRVMLDRAPSTLNPRHAADAVGQRVNGLLFRGLTRIDAHLDPQPDLAAAWQVLDGGKTWKFTIRKHERDQGGELITAERVARCLENYRIGKPSSIYRAGFPGWIATEAKDESVQVKLERADPYFPRNVSLLRYFRVQGASETAGPCSEPSGGQTVIGSGMYRLPVWNPAPESEFDLIPFEPIAQGRVPMRMVVIPDETSRALNLLRGEVDATQNTLWFETTQWLHRKHPGKFDLIESDGVNTSYLSMNLRDPLLSRKEVRQAIALSIDRELITRNKLGFCKPAGSLLSPKLHESHGTTFAYDPARAEAILDKAGLKRPHPGAPRFELHFRSTPEGGETVLMLQDMLERVGIHIIIDMVEPAVFSASVRKGAYQLYQSRWIGVADASILYRTLRSGQPDNRAGYSNPEMDKLLDAAVTETDLERRLPFVQKAQTLMAEDLPYFPLWHWSNLLVVRKGLQGVTAADLSLSGGYEPLTHLHR